MKTIIAAAPGFKARWFEQKNANRQKHACNF